MLFSHGSNHSKGVMILIKPSFDIEIKWSIQDKQGRCIILEAKVYESNFIFVNIHTPNDCTHQTIFYKSLQERPKEFSNENLIIGGDFNCVLSSLDKKKVLRLYICRAFRLFAARTSYNACSDHVHIVPCCLNLQHFFE